MGYRAEIAAFAPQSEQERADQSLILELCGQYGDQILSRVCRAAHLTGSGFIMNETFDKTLMVYHNIYQSWSWTGGHADGDSDLLAVAMREAMEETGVTRIQPLSSQIAALDILCVQGHVKRGAYVSAHLHLSAAYLLVAPEDQPLTIKEDENSGVRWIPVDRLAEFCTEPEMLPVYRKLIEKSRALSCNYQKS